MTSSRRAEGRSVFGKTINIVIAAGHAAVLPRLPTAPSFLQASGSQWRHREPLRRRSPALYIFRQQCRNIRVDAACQDFLFILHGFIVSNALVTEALDGCIPPMVFCS